MNRGKQFEAQVKDAALKCPHTSVDRLKDTMSGYKGDRNVCDFIIYRYPYQYYIECKAVSVATLNFKSHISQGQWDGLLQKSKIYGVTAGILVWFVLHNKTIFIPIQALEKMRSEGIKSFKVTALPDEHCIELYGRKKRILFDYEFKTFLDNLEVWTRTYGNSE